MIPTKTHSFTIGKRQALNLKNLFKIKLCSDFFIKNDSNQGAVPTKNSDNQIVLCLHQLF